MEVGVSKLLVFIGQKFAVDFFKLWCVQESALQFLVDVILAV